MNFLEANMLINQIHAVSIMTDQEREYLFTLAQQSDNNPIMEVGCAAGGTTILFALASGHCYALDNGAGEDHRKHFLNNLAKAGVRDNVSFYYDDSLSVAKIFPDQSFGLVLIDAEHTGDHPYQDLIAWAPKVKHGGYLLTDDLSDGTPDVTIGVIKFLTKNHNFEYVRCFERIDNGYKQIKLLSLRKK